MARHIWQLKHYKFKRKKIKRNSLKKLMLSYLTCINDILTVAHDPLGASKTLRDVNCILKTVGFLLRKWAVNNTTLFQNILHGHLLWQELIKLSNNKKTQTLHLKWNVAHSYFYITHCTIDNYLRIEILKALRYVNYHPNFNVQLHGFCNVSKNVYFRS